VDPVPDPLLFFSGSAGNRTRASGSVAKNKNIIQFIEAQRLRWLGRVERMPEERCDKKICEWKLTASRSVGRPTVRWMDKVMRGNETVN
jgi:hypothetical protein